MLNKIGAIATSIALSFSFLTADKWSSRTQEDYTPVVLKENQEIVTFTHETDTSYCVLQPSAEIESTICVDKIEYPFMLDLEYGTELKATFKNEERWELTNLEEWK
jgi:hypothetical protein